ncbi:MAG: hypothetical protein C4519_01055 [Desulfobacteraceae bacterium]|nr:MAG: hypothetical protein C4519_01055 [Desulfobacteraceae bacterium]
MQAKNRLSRSNADCFVTLLHFIPLPGQLRAHFLHRKLFFFPDAGCFLVGHKGGLLVALAISIVHTDYFAHPVGTPPELMATVFSRRRSSSPWV